MLGIYKDKSNKMQKIDKDKIKIILVEPQLSENIGTAARAMLNFGLDSLYTCFSQSKITLSLKSIRACCWCRFCLGKCKNLSIVLKRLSQIHLMFLLVQ